MRYRIKNWREFQHYKGRRPPWIKFHSNTFTSKDWSTLADASKLAMVVCMVVASMDDAGDGSFDGDADYLKRVAYLDIAPDLSQLLTSGFLVVASTCKQTLANASPSVSVSEEILNVEEREIGDEPETIEEKAADLASEFVFQFRGKKPFVEDIRLDLQEKLRVYGQHHFAFIMKKIKGNRDKTFPLFKFWLSLKIEDQKPSWHMDQPKPERAEDIDARNFRDYCQQMIVENGREEAARKIMERHKKPLPEGL